VMRYSAPLSARLRSCVTRRRLRRTCVHALLGAAFAEPEVSNVEVSDVERVLFDERAPKLDVLAHEHGEELVGAARRVLVADLEERARVGVHRRGPELLGIHLAEALVAREDDALAATLVDELGQ